MGSIFLFMYTFTHAHRQKINFLCEKSSPESGISHNSIAEKNEMTPESLKKVQEFAQRVIDAFEQNPEQRSDFLNTLDGMKQQVFRDPIMFRAFLNRAYEKHDLAMTSLV